MYSPKVPIKDYSNWIHQLGARDSGNDFRFPDIAAYTGRFHFLVVSLLSFLFGVVYDREENTQI